LYSIIALLIAIIVALLAVIRTLAYDPNYGILTAAAGLFLVHHDRRRRDLILLDFDNFKAFNTAHGHSEADRRVRGVWHLAFRRADDVRIVKRGGDELLLSCPVGYADQVLDIAAARLAAVGLTATACVQVDSRDMRLMLEAAERRILVSKARNEKNCVLYLV